MTNTAKIVPHRVVIDHDAYADFSWLDQDCFEGSDYRDPNDHVALELVAYDIDGNVLDSLSNIDFLAHEDNWRTGTFYKCSQLSVSPYLQEIARDMGLPE